MKKLNLILLCSFCISLLVGCEQKSSEWKLVWEDDFNQTDGFDQQVWTKVPRGNPDWKNYMSDLDELFAVRDGNLILRGIINNVLPNDTAPFLTGGVETLNKKYFENGRLEIRAKLYGATGAWPAIWMVGKEGRWPYCGEIDIMERLNDEDIAYQTVHSPYTQKGFKEHPKQGVTGPINKDDYNVYAVEMYTDSLVFYINDLHTYTYPRIETQEEGQFPFNQPFQLRISMQLGGSWVGEVDPADLPVEMWVDWVRFYQKQE